MEVTPGEIGLRVGICLFMGMSLGGMSDLTLPLRKRFPVLTDSVLSLWIIWVWLVIAFDVCDADIRMGYCIAAALGAMCWRGIFSPVIRPIWIIILGKISLFLGIPWNAYKKFLEKLKKTLSIGRKIGYNRKSKMPQ